MKKLTNEQLERLNIQEFKEATKNPIIIILDNIRSLNNIGSVFRTADAFLIENIVSKVKQENGTLYVSDYSKELFEGSDVSIHSLADFNLSEAKENDFVFIENRDYATTNNIYSLWLARNEMSNDNTILLELDLIFEDKVISDMVKNSDKNLIVKSILRHTNNI